MQDYVEDCRQEILQERREEKQRQNDVKKKQADAARRKRRQRQLEAMRGLAGSAGDEEEANA